MECHERITYARDYQAKQGKTDDGFPRFAHNKCSVHAEKTEVADGGGQPSLFREILWTIASRGSLIVGLVGAVLGGFVARLVPHPQVRRASYGDGR